MKKFFCVLLVLMLMPIFAFADDSLVGCWYIYYDKKEYPEIAENFQGYDLVISMYIFWSDGSISLLENDIAGKSGSPTFDAAGKWESSDSGYKFSIIGFGSGDVFAKDDILYLQIPNTSVYAQLRKLITFDPYNDYSRK